MEGTHSIETVYSGSLRTSAKHLKSGESIITDAPTDNNGRGEAFSPTDLVATALSSCMMTIMGIYAERVGIDISGMASEVVKVMSGHPRKIAEIQVRFSHQGIQASESQLSAMKKAALSCPVALSLSPELKQTVSFDF